MKLDYVVKMVFGQFRNKNHRHIRMYCESLDEHLTDWDNGDVLRWGIRSNMRDDMVLVTDDLIHQFPALIDPKKWTKWLR
jgi:hypothetical protein